MFGTIYFGQTYFAGVAFEPSPSGSRANCGGMFGTATFGQPYFGMHFQCGVVPPNPPIPSQRKKGRENPQPGVNEAMEEEDLELILALWMQLR